MSGFAIERADFYTFSGEDVTPIVGVGEPDKAWVGYK